MLLAYVVGLLIGETIRDEVYRGKKHQAYSGLFILLKHQLVVAPLSSARWYHRSQIPTEVGPMNRKPHSQNPPCPRCGATHVIQNGSQGGRPRWVCRNGGRSFGPTLGTAMDRLRAAPTEVARTLLVVMRRGSLSAAEEITGHQVETIRRWRRAAARHAEALTEVLVHDLHLSEVEVDAFWSFVNRSYAVGRVFLCVLS
jgi:transposase-like protein